MVIFHEVLQHTQEKNKGRWKTANGSLVRSLFGSCNATIDGFQHSDYRSMILISSFLEKPRRTYFQIENNLKLCRTLHYLHAASRFDKHVEGHVRGTGVVHPGMCHRRGFVQQLVCQFPYSVSVMRLFPPYHFLK
mmetsp:Transcript_62106/g.74729  ORF Transcript_62106/g.74729 Transcript_62106/m.74729 type:complete len:135 (-) Transcript_62106:158-562(-)